MQHLLDNANDIPNRLKINATHGLTLKTIETDFIKFEKTCKTCMGHFKCFNSKSDFISIIKSCYKKSLERLNLEKLWLHVLSLENIIMN